jgi:sugar lactone lactonase YvrE
MTLPAQLAVDCGCRLGEGPVWDVRTNRLLWVDILSARVHALDPRTGEASSISCAEQVTSLVPDAAGGFVATTAHGFARFDPSTGGTQPIVSVESGERTRMNDGKCDPNGRFVAGSMAVDLTDTGAGALYSLEPDCTARVLLRAVTISNGLDWSPDGETFFYVDSGAEGIDRFDYDSASGDLSGRTRIVSLPRSAGLLDGLAVDEEGCLWVAIAYSGCVVRYSPEGEKLATVTVPTSVPTSCCFGGAELDQLFVTTAAEYVPEDARAGEPARGGLFVCEPGVAGQPARRFGPRVAA